MNLVKELEDVKRSNVIEVDEIEAITDTRRLLEGDGQEDLRIARALGKHNSIVRAEDILGQKMELENLDKKFSGGVFSEEDIKTLCLKYNLRFLKSEHYAGGLDVQALHKLKAFAKSSGIELNNATISYNVFIMAPSSTFKLETYKAERIKLQFPDTDPIMFYKVANDKFKLIHKWGADFTWTRRITGFFRQSLFNRVVGFATVGTLIALAATFLGLPIWVAPITALVAALIAIVPYLAIDKPEDVNMFFTEHNWNQVKKVE